MRRVRPVRIRPAPRRGAWTASVAALLYFAVVGCHLAPQGGMADRCADIMTAAYPGADIEVTKREASVTSLTRIVARVEGHRKNLPSNPPIARRLAVECTFDNNVLTGFHWTSGPN